MSLIAALAAGLALSASPTPQTDILSDLKPADRADLQCMALLSVMVGAQQDQVGKLTFTAGVTYYLGRLQGRTPEIKWVDRLVAYARTEPTADLEANRQRCAAEMQEMGRIMTAAGTGG